MTFDDYGVLTSWNGESIQLDATIDADPGIQEQILAQMDEVRASSSKVVGKAAIDIEWQVRCCLDSPPSSLCSQPPHTELVRLRRMCHRRLDCRGLPQRHGNSDWAGERRRSLVRSHQHTTSSEDLN